MDDLTRRVQPGDPLAIRAATWNKMLEATRAARGKGARPTGGPLTVPTPPNSLVVSVRNDTGGTLPIRNVVQVSYPLEIPTLATLDVQDNLGWSGIVATSTAGTPAITLDGAAAGEIVRAVIMGVALVSVDITDAGHTRAGLAVGVHGHLVSGTSGPATILWREEGTGVKLCGVLLCCGTGVPAVGDAEDWEYPAPPDYAWPNCCGGSLPIPGRFYLNLINKTGLFACLPNSIEFLAADGFDVGMTQRQHNTTFDGSGCTPAGDFTASANWTCGGGGTTYSVIISISPPAGFGTWQGFVTTTGVGTWSGGTGPTGFGLSSASRACGAEPFAEEEPIGSASLDLGSGVVGTMDMVLSR